MKSRQSACRNLRTEVVNTFDDSPVSAFAYDYDAAGRRIQRLDGRANPPDEPLAVTNIFAYNQLSELTGAVMPALIPAGDTNTFAYQYDPIGNRQWARANEVTNLYQANELNQYTNINQGAVEPVYDLDGNMTQLGPWAYDWDGENRLISVSSNGVPVVQNQYDYMSRRIMKATATQTNTFLYDGWNLVREDLGAAAPSSRSYVWGLDLSQSLQGAGGVGGLLAILSPDSCLLSPAYDANGNVTDLVDTSGVVVAHYEYDPYGNTIAQSGDYADLNPLRFSSKYWDGETEFYYYGYRYYSPERGRWISSDPQNEIGSLNVIYKDVLADLRQKRALADAARIQNANQNPEITPDILAYLNQKYRTEFVLPSAVSSEPDVLMVIMAVDPNLYLFVVNNPVFFVDVDGRDWWPPSKWPIWPKPKDPGTWPIPGKPTCKKVKICGKEVYLCYWKNPDPDPQPDDPKVCCWISIPW